jgi:phosphatidylglycerophosphate synthase
MFDARLRPLIDPTLNAIGRTLAGLGISANAITLIAVLPGVAAAVAIAHGQHGLALALILVNRIADGLDGAVARARGPTDFGGYLDIVSDFIVYTAVPLGFGLASPANLVPALLLIASFTLTGVSFLAFAAIAGQRGEKTTAHGKKSFFYSTGIAEGTETILCFVGMCLWPQHFPAIALAYAGLCGLTVVQRSLLAWQQFRRPRP